MDRCGCPNITKTLPPYVAYLHLVYCHEVTDFYYIVEKRTEFLLVSGQSWPLSGAFILRKFTLTKTLPTLIRQSLETFTWMFHATLTPTWTTITVKTGEKLVPLKTTATWAAKNCGLFPLIWVLKPLTVEHFCLHCHFADFVASLEKEINELFWNSAHDRSTFSIS